MILLCSRKRKKWTSLFLTPLLTFSPPKKKIHSTWSVRHTREPNLGPVHFSSSKCEKPKMPKKEGESPLLSQLHKSSFLLRRREAVTMGDCFAASPSLFGIIGCRPANSCLGIYHSMRGGSPELWWTMEECLPR